MYFIGAFVFNQILHGIQTQKRAKHQYSCYTTKVMSSCGIFLLHHNYGEPRFQNLFQTYSSILSTEIMPFVS